MTLNLENYGVKTDKQSAGTTALQRPIVELTVKEEDHLDTVGKVEIYEFVGEPANAPNIHLDEWGSVRKMLQNTEVGRRLDVHTELSEEFDYLIEYQHSGGSVPKLEFYLITEKNLRNWREDMEEKYIIEEHTNLGAHAGGVRQLNLQEGTEDQIF